MKEGERKSIREKKEKEMDTMDVYNEKELEEMLENDEITEAEYNFMLGREKVSKAKKLGLERKEHQDTHAGELAKTEYEDD
ncbi:MAG: hypothetical protein CW691_02770 [Candidatus Bathyarchaeum sp.]|nr:MAG: hypothetical protein CW691_02770 [Candidatus Bathyarchaeum sp.]